MSGGRSQSRMTRANSSAGLAFAAKAYGTVAFGKRGGNKRVAWAGCCLLYLVRLLVYIRGKDISWGGEGKMNIKGISLRPVDGA